MCIIIIPIFICSIQSPPPLLMIRLPPQHTVSFCLLSIEIFTYLIQSPSSLLTNPSALCKENRPSSSLQHICRNARRPSNAVVPAFTASMNKSSDRTCCAKDGRKELSIYSPSLEPALVIKWWICNWLIQQVVSFAVKWICQKADPSPEVLCRAGPRGVVRDRAAAALIPD